MIIVLTPEQEQRNEQDVISQLFEAGLKRFHIRKFRLTDTEMKRYLDAVDPVFCGRLVLHTHYHLARDYGISRLHFREADRANDRHTAYKNDYTLSTSVHDITAFNGLTETWQYAFLSPMYPSISKQGYGAQHTVLPTLCQRSNKHGRLIGLGGIDAQNFKEVIKNGADGIALLGSIWQATDPVTAYKTIQSAYEQL